MNQIQVHFIVQTTTHLTQIIMGIFTNYTYLQVEGTVTDEPSNLYHVEVKGRLIFIGREENSLLTGRSSNSWLRLAVACFKHNVI